MTSAVITRCNTIEPTSLNLENLSPSDDAYSLLPIFGPFEESRLNIVFCFELIMDIICSLCEEPSYSPMDLFSVFKHKNNKNLRLINGKALRACYKLNSP